MINPVPKVTDNNRWVLWTLSFLNAVVFVAIVTIVSRPARTPRVDLPDAQYPSLSLSSLTQPKHWES